MAVVITFSQGAWAARHSHLLEIVGLELRGAHHLALSRALTISCAKVNADARKTSALCHREVCLFLLVRRVIRGHGQRRTDQLRYSPDLIW
jgi:hypothetical protein